MRSRREFIQLASVSAMLLATKSWNAVAAKQQLKTEDLLDFDTKGQVTLLHLTDLHGQLKPVYFRPPSENFGVGKFEGIPPHLIGEAFSHNQGWAEGALETAEHLLQEIMMMDGPSWLSDEDFCKSMPFYMDRASNSRRKLKKANE